MMCLSKELASSPSSHRYMLQGVLYSFRASFPFQNSRQIAVMQLALSAASSVCILAFFCVNLGLFCRRPPPAELRGVNQAFPSMPARSHFGVARSNLPSGYSLVLCFKPVEQEALWYGSSRWLSLCYIVILTSS
ncbi:Uncharacterized protein Rs2_45025 [Raphanus sativus]|nr:Uncharacterized protein Rs2_45025 [Raphanus sativus]